MSKVNKLLIVLALSLIFVAGIAFAGASDKINAGNNKIDKKVLESLKSENKTRVIVYLDESLRASEIASFKSKARRDFGNAFSMDVSNSELEELAKSSKIAEIKQERNLEIFMQDSVNITNASITWPLQIGGVNLTGRGKTICIADTGVNYTHSALGGCSNDTFLAGNCKKVLAGYDFYNGDSNPVDDNGHGTHVSGIAAANGTTIKGIAPEANLVMLKVCNSAGNNCPEGDIAAAIDWCVGNSSLYNISVISLSLGSSEIYSDYCDDGSIINRAINDAVAKNISVVVATGNDGSSSNISFPACLRNATRAGAVKKDGSLVYNRNWMVNLLAPGYDITSTWFNGGYYTLSGTSMATPAVAGALIIMNEFLSLKNRTSTPRETEIIFNNTGRRVYDSASGLNFSIINVYNVITYFLKPNITLASPSDKAFTNNSDLNFTCNISVDSDYDLVNVTFYLWNSTLSLIYNKTLNISGVQNSSIFNYTIINESVYYWNCMASSNLSLIGSGSANHSLTYDITPPNVSLNSPANDSSYTGSQTLSFDYNASDNFNVSRCNLILNGASVASNSSAINMSSTNNITYTVGAGSYLWNISCVDLAGNARVSETRALTVNSGGGGGGGGGGGPSSTIKIVNQTNLTVSNASLSNQTVSNLGTNLTNASAQTGAGAVETNKSAGGRQLHIFKDNGFETIKGVLMNVSETIKNNIPLFILSVAIIVGVGIAIGYFLRYETEPIKKNKIK